MKLKNRTCINVYICSIQQYKNSLIKKKNSIKIAEASDFPQFNIHFGFHRDVGIMFVLSTKITVAREGLRSTLSLIGAKDVRLLSRSLLCYMHE